MATAGPCIQKHASASSVQLPIWRYLLCRIMHNITSQYCCLLFAAVTSLNPSTALLEHHEQWTTVSLPPRPYSHSVSSIPSLALAAVPADNISRLRQHNATYSKALPLPDSTCVPVHPHVDPHAISLPSYILQRQQVRIFFSAALTTAEDIIQVPPD